jgi:hypothetical protein
MVLGWSAKSEINTKEEKQKQISEVPIEKHQSVLDLILNQMQLGPARLDRIIVKT